MKLLRNKRIVVPFRIIPERAYKYVVNGKSAIESIRRWNKSQFKRIIK